MNPIKTVGIFTYMVQRTYYAKGDPAASEEFSDMDGEIKAAGYIGLVSGNILTPLGLTNGVRQSPLSAEDVGCRLYPSVSRGNDPDFAWLMIPAGTLVYVMKVV